jgi:multiple sugar transport system substrate-binding protein
MYEARIGRLSKPMALRGGTHVAEEGYGLPGFMRGCISTRLAGNALKVLRRLCMRLALRQWCLALLLAMTCALLAACGGANQGAGEGGTTGTMAPATGGEAATTAPATGGEGSTTGTTAPATGGEAATTAPTTGSEAATAPATGGSTGTVGELPADCTNVSLEYWNPFTGPDGPFMGQLTDSFNAANPNIQVLMTSQAEYYTQLGTAAASNTLPDVVIVHADQVATQAFRNVLRPIDDLVSQMGVSEADFPEAVWQAGEVAGKRYAIPLDIHPAVLYYNADLLQQAGISAPPTNDAEFQQAAQALTQGENKGFLLTSGFFSQMIFMTLLHQYGGSEFNEDGTEATFNSEAGVRALQWMLDVQQKYGEPNLETDAEINGFKTGTVGMMMNGIWQVTNVTGEAVEFQGQGTAVPTFGDQPAVWAGSHQLALTVQPDDDPCRDAGAAIFIKYLLDNSVEWAKAGQIPANTAVRESDEFLAIEPQASIAPSVENAFFPPSTPGITDALGPMTEAVSAIMAGTQTDIQAALDDAKARADQILTENRNTYGEAPAG